MTTASFTVTSPAGSHSVLIDSGMVERVAQHSWHVHNKAYIATVVHHRNGEKEYIYLHRFVIADEIAAHESSTGKRSRITFRDGNKMNCTRANIEIQAPPKVEDDTSRPKTSRYRGLSYIRTTNRWRCKLVFQKENVLERQFKTEQEALLNLNAVKEVFNRRIRNGEFGEEADLLDIQAWVGPTRPIEFAKSNLIDDSVASKMEEITKNQIPVNVILETAPDSDVEGRLRAMGMKRKSYDTYTGERDAMQIAELSYLPQVRSIISA